MDELTDPYAEAIKIVAEHSVKMDNALLDLIQKLVDKVRQHELSIQFLQHQIDDLQVKH